MTGILGQSLSGAIVHTNCKSEAAPEALQSGLQRFFGYDTFRPPQAEIVRCLLAQQDALILMPTGGGKSICFQLPALMRSGLTLVISPLVALMENQVQELQQRKLPAALLHSQLTNWERKRTLQSLSRFRLLYLSPETLLSSPVWERLSQPDLKLNTLVLDEAHCLSQWGDTFRPAYFRLGAVRSALLQTRPAGSRLAIAAFTATADPQTQETIQRVLQLQQLQVFRGNPYRSNLHLRIQIAWTPHGRRQQLWRFVQARPGQTGLVYVRTRRDSEELADWLRSQGLRTAAYHAGLSSEERRQLEQDWLTGKLPSVVCTSAFGMGINKPDCRWVVHFQMPLLLAEYVQEVGRAGRDGQPADALALVSEPTGWLDSEDRQRWQFFEQRGRSLQQTAQQLARKLPQQGTVAAASEQFREGALALSWLHGTGQLTWQDPFHYTLRSPSRADAMQANVSAVQQMGRYLKTRNCRWQFLLQAFGFTETAIDFRCGSCDNCTRSA